MINKASGRAALIVAAGLFVLFASPAMATDGGDSAASAAPDGQAAPAPHRTFRHASHHRRHYAHRRLHPIAKADDDDEKKAPTADTTTTTTTGDNRPLAQIPPSIANANAQMLLAGAQISAAATIPAGTDIPATTTETANADNNETVVAASDQLNDSDRTLQESGPTAAAAASSPPATTMTGDSTVWDQTSLIGKIFIGFGALLTMASAVRMFIA